MRNIRRSIFIVTMALLAIGVVMIYSSSAVYAHEKMGDSLFFLKRHILFLFIGFLSALFVMAFDYRKLKDYSRFFIFLGIVLLLLVLVPKFGVEVGGARRWFRIYKYGFQPAEMVKLGIIIYLADFLSRKAPYINKVLTVLLPLLIVCGTVMGLILLQPDLGTVIVIAALTFILLFSAGVKWPYIFSLAVISLPIFYLLVWNVPYRLNRIKIFLNPWQDPRGAGFQMIQSFLAFGSGGLFGVGLGMSRQKLFYLPEAHTDFIFSIIGEELGFIGTSSVILLFLVLIWQGMRIAFKAEDLFGRFLSLGIISMIALEVIINIGVSIGSLPTKGLTLPFISYGGSALIFHMIAIGILLNIARGAKIS